MPLEDWHHLLTSPLALAVFSLWMLVYAICNREYRWGGFIYIGWPQKG